jgi:hypothetical protein
MEPTAVDGYLTPIILLKHTINLWLTICDMRGSVVQLWNTRSQTVQSSHIKSDYQQANVWRGQLLLGCYQILEAEKQFLEYDIEIQEWDGVAVIELYFTQTL